MYDPLRPRWAWPKYSRVGEASYGLMGVLNVTPDSFYDGGAYYKATAHPSARPQAVWVDRAIKRGVAMFQAGARYIDVGGESSRPGADPVSVEEERSRVIPVIQGLSAALPNAVISIDTVKPEIADEAILSGARVINDISGLSNPEMRSIATRHHAGVVIMHMRGTPKTMQEGDLSAADIVEVVYHALREAAERALADGLTPAQIALDIGIGFGKTVQQNIDLLAGLERFLDLGYPLLVGASRKSMIGAITGAPVESRLPGSLAALIEARRRGASIFRVHDVAESAQALQVSEAIQLANGGALSTDDQGSDSVVSQGEVGQGGASCS